MLVEYLFPGVFTFQQMWTAKLHLTHTVIISVKDTRADILLKGGNRFVKKLRTLWWNGPLYWIKSWTYMRSILGGSYPLLDRRSVILLLILCMYGTLLEAPLDGGQCVERRLLTNAKILTGTRLKCCYYSSNYFVPYISERGTHFLGCSRGLLWLSLSVSHWVGWETSWSDSFQWLIALNSHDQGQPIAVHICTQPCSFLSWLVIKIKQC